MAEIRVEPKSNKPIWPWIVGALVLIGLIWGIAELLEEDPREPEMAVVETTTIQEERVVNEDMMTATTTGAVTEYVNFAENEARTPDMGLDHEYTSEGIQKLKAALVAVANEQAAGDVNIEQKKQTFEQAADKIQQDPMSLQHANTIKDAFTSAADLMESLQEKNYPNLNDQVESVKQTAQSIDTTTPTLDQKDKVKQFFQESADAVEAMANRTTTGTTNMNTNQ